MLRVAYIFLVCSVFILTISCSADEKAIDSDPFNTAGTEVPDNLDDDDDNNDDNDTTQTECVDDTECLDGWNCIDGFCSLQCVAQEDCEKGFYCDESGHCLKGCINNDNCKPGFSCVGGECISDADDDDIDDDDIIDDDDDVDDDDIIDDDDSDECECTIPGADYKCDDGECIFQQCKDGYLNLNGSLDDGCEYECTVSNNGEEICDDLDNDCDGATDNLLDFMSNVEHCGGCDTQCPEPPNSTSLCQHGKCSFICKEGAFDNDGNPDNGCEATQCIESNNGIEICDGKDNDCDDIVDEGYEKDKAYSCGPGCVDCTKLAPHYVYNCVEGVCVFEGCEEHWNDVDGNVENGCEYRCTPSGIGYEQCNGRDDDCDPATADGSNDPDVGLECEPESAVPGCEKGAIICNILGVLECKALGGTPEVCNSIDDDCNGIIDDNAPCAEGERCSGGSCVVTSGCSDDCSPEGVTCEDEFMLAICSNTDEDECLELAYEYCDEGTACYNAECVTVCESDCTGKECGDDGCGGSCGECLTAPADGCKDEFTALHYSEWGECLSGGCYYEPAEESCGYRCEGGVCVTCNPDCTDKECGGDGCGGSCGTCNIPPDDTCKDSTYLLQYADSGACTGDGKCEYTSTEIHCEFGCSSGMCSGCVADCTGKECGNDGCGGSCGDCDSPPADYCLDGWTLRVYVAAGNCNNGACEYTSTDSSCPYGCDNGQCAECVSDCTGLVCGDDGCGGSCGDCPQNEICWENECYSVGCADGTVEGYSDDGMMFACRGAWKIKGLAETSAECNRKAGNDGENVNGDGCTIQDLCTEGYHVCRMEKSGSGDYIKEVEWYGGCSLNDFSPGFYTCTQKSYKYDSSKCGFDSTKDNNFFGCRTPDVGRQPNDNCYPLNGKSADRCADNNFPEDTWNCGNSSSSEWTEVVHGTGRGGVLCCID